MWRLQVGRRSGDLERVVTWYWIQSQGQVHRLNLSQPCVCVRASLVSHTALKGQDRDRSLPSARSFRFQHNYLLLLCEKDTRQMDTLGTGWGKGLCHQMGTPRDEGRDSLLTALLSPLSVIFMLPLHVCTQTTDRLFGEGHPECFRSWVFTEHERIWYLHWSFCVTDVLKFH